MVAGTYDGRGRLTVSLHSGAAGGGMYDANGAYVLNFGGAILVEDNVASAYTVSDDGGIEYFTVVSTNVQPELVINEGGVDVDTRIEAVGRTHAVYVVGSTGNVLVGTNAQPSGVSHLVVYDVTVTTITHYHGIYNWHIITNAAGATEADDVRGIWSWVEMNDAGETIGHLFGIQVNAVVTAGTIGDGDEDVRGGVFIAQMAGGTAGNDVMGVLARADLNTGTVANDVYGGYFDVDVEVGMTAIGGNIYGVYVIVDDDDGTATTVYMLYLDEATGIDYGIYQNGTADNYFGGDVGIGAIPATITDAHLLVYNATLVPTSNYYGIYNHHVITDATGMSEADDVWGIRTTIEMNDAGEVIGHLRAVYGSAIVTAGTIGDGQEDVFGGQFIAQIAGGTADDDVTGVLARADLNTGTVTDNVYGGYFDVDIEAGMTSVGGDAFGVYVIVDDDDGTATTVYMLYLDGRTNVDYGLYQVGGQDNYFSGAVGVGVVAPGEMVEVSGNQLFQNADWLMWKDVGGTKRNVLTQTAANVVELNAAVGNIFLDPAGGNVVCDGNVIPDDTKSFNLGAPGAIWGGVWYVTLHGGTGRLVESTRICPVCGEQMKRGTGTMITEGEHADYALAFCIKCGVAGMEELCHLTNEDLMKRRDMPEITFEGVRVSGSGLNRSVSLDFSYGDVQNSTVLGELEFIAVMEMDEAERLEFLKELGQREWEALEETRLMQEKVRGLQATFDDLFGEWVGKDLLQVTA